MKIAYDRLPRAHTTSEAVAFGRILQTQRRRGLRAGETAPTGCVTTASPAHAWPDQKDDRFGESEERPRFCASQALLTVCSH
jgi:hypothetical protein